MCDVVRVNKYFGVEAFVRSSHRSRLPTIWRTSDGVGGRADRRSAGGALGTGGGAVGGGGGGEGLGGVVLVSGGPVCSSVRCLVVIMALLLFFGAGIGNRSCTSSSYLKLVCVGKHSLLNTGR